MKARKNENDYKIIILYRRLEYIIRSYYRFNTVINLKFFKYLKFDGSRAWIFS